MSNDWPFSQQEIEARIEAAKKQVDMAELKRLQSTTVTERLEELQRKAERHEISVKEQEDRDDARLKELYQKMRQSLCDDEQVDEVELLDDFEEKWRETLE